MKYFGILAIVGMLLALGVSVAQAEEDGSADKWIAKGEIFAIPRLLPSFDPSRHKVGDFREIVYSRKINENTSLQFRRSVGTGLDGSILFETKSVCLVRYPKTEGADYYVVCGEKEDQVLKMEHGLAICPKGLCMSAQVGPKAVVYSEWTFVGSFEHTVGRTFVFPVDREKPAFVFSSQAYSPQ